jgi:hypothetical protein
MSTEAEHAAMEAAGMTDEELSAHYRTWRHEKHMTMPEWQLRRAVVDELNNRALARFQSTTEAKRNAK